MTRQRWLSNGRIAVGATVVMLAALVAPLAVPAPQAGAATGFAFRRIAGPDRYATAAAIATDTYATASGAVIATGETFPDALAASFIAGYFNAPILLTERAHLPAVTQDALTKLGVKQVLLLGGEAAISKEVAQQLDVTYDLVRVPGADRFVTAANVALMVNAGDAGEIDGKRTVFLTNGYDYPDALAIGPLANAGRFPILLNGSGLLGTPTRVVLQDPELKIEQVVIVGGPAAISEDAQQQIEQMGIATSRISGADRFATAAAVADFALDKLDFIPDHVNLAKGFDPLDARQGFADALAGGVQGGREHAPLLLTDPRTLSMATRGWIDRHAAALTDGDVLGGEAAVSAAVVQEGEAVAAGIAPPLSASGTVTDVDRDGNAYTFLPDGTTQAVFVAYTATDEFVVDGAPATLEQFEASLSVGDGISYTATPPRHELVNPVAPTAPTTPAGDTGTVTDVDLDGNAYNYVTAGSSTPVFVAYTAADQFVVDGAPATFAQFEAALSVGDGIRYTATPARHELVNR